MNNAFEETLEQYMDHVTKRKADGELVVQLMLIAELKGIRDNLSWLSQDAREKHYG